MKKTKDSQETKILRKPVARIETTADTGLTQAQVAEKVGTTARAYQYYEAGEREPSVKTAILIARTVKSTVEKLFG